MKTLFFALLTIGILGSVLAGCPNNPLSSTLCSSHDDCPIGKICLSTGPQNKFCCDELVCRKSGLKATKDVRRIAEFKEPNANQSCDPGYEPDQLVNGDPSFLVCCPKPTSVLFSDSTPTLPLLGKGYMQCEMNDPTSCPLGAFCGYARNINEPNEIEPAKTYCYSFTQEENTYVDPHGYCLSDKDCSDTQACTKKDENQNWYDSENHETGLCGEVRCPDGGKPIGTCGAEDKCPSIGITDYECVKSAKYGVPKKCCPILKPPICPGFPFLKERHLRKCNINSKICEQDLFGYCDGNYCCPTKDRSESARTLMNFTDAVANLRLNWTYFKDEYGLFSIFGTTYNYTADIVVWDICDSNWECPPRQSCANVGLRNDPFLVCITAPFDHLQPKHRYSHVYRLKVIFGFLWVAFLWSGATVLLYHSWRAMVQDEEQEERERIAALNRRVVWD